jgi:hypothetical protein
MLLPLIPPYHLINPISRPHLLQPRHPLANPFRSSGVGPHLSGAFTCNILTPDPLNSSHSITVDRPFTLIYSSSSFGAEKMISDKVQVLMKRLRIDNRRSAEKSICDLSFASPP